MKELLKKEFQKRIANAGRKELLLIHFDMISTELELIDLSIKAENVNQFKNSIQLCQELVKKLVESLDFSYDISQELFKVYQGINQELIQIKISKNVEKLNQIINLIHGLRESFASIDIKNDTVLVENSEKVYAGLTYGKNNQLNESIDYKNRGLKA